MSKPLYTYAELMEHLANLARAVNRIIETNIIGWPVGAHVDEYSIALHAESDKIIEAAKQAEAYFAQAAKDMEVNGFGVKNGPA